MKKILKRTSLLLISALMSIAAAQAQKSPQDMDRFIDALMKKMTDAPDHAHQGALVGAGSPRFLVSPFNPDAPIEGGISGAAKGALAGFIPPVVPSGTDSPSTPSKHDGIGVSGRSQAHETLGAMTTVIMRTSHDTRGRLFLALFQGFRFLGNMPITLVLHEAPTGTQE